MRKNYYLLILLLTILSSSSYSRILNYTVTTQDPQCAGDTGYAKIDNLITSPPSGPYRYEWINITMPSVVIATGDSVNLPGGTYRVNAFDLGDPSSPVVTRQFRLQDPFLIIPFLRQDTISCFNAMDGDAIVNPNGATNPPLNYTWLNSVGTILQSNTTFGEDTLKNLGTGKYFVRVTDANNCSVLDSIIMVQPTAILANVTTTAIDCNGGTSTATASASGGTNKGYSYTWSSTPSNNTATEPGLAGSTTGISYTVTVTDSDNCTNSETFTVFEPAPISIAVSTDSVDCFGDASGSATATVTGGTMPYTYTWPASGTPSNNSVSGLIAGNYNVTVQDANACQGIQAFTIGSEAELIVVLDSTDVDCNGNSTGSVSVTITGGSPPYSFVWSDGTTRNNISSGVTSTTNGLAANTYSITVTDDLGCPKVDSIVVNEPTALSFSVDSQGDPTCVNGTDGFINITVSGGFAPYGYLWNDGNTGEDRTNLGSGNYAVTVTDANGCPIIGRDTLVDPQPIVPNVTTTPTKCKAGGDGTATANPTGGKAPYTYMWSSSGNTTNTETGLSSNSYTVTVTDSDNCTGTETFFVNEPTIAFSVSVTTTDVSCSGGSDGTASIAGSGGSTPYTFVWSAGTPNGNGTTTTGLSLGNYSVTATDANGCDIVENFMIVETNPIVISLDSTDVLCFGENTGSIRATFNGGTPPYSYLFSNGSNGSNIAAGVTVSNNNLIAGTYKITVTDVNMCTKEDSIVVNEPADLTVTIASQSDPLCNGDLNGTINITPSGGPTGTSYSYLWADGPTVQNRTGLAAGTYTVVVTDDNSCTATVSTTLQDPQALVVTIDSTRDISCNGANDGFLRVNASGGTNPLTYDWGGGINTAANDNLPPGTYTVTVTDNNGCPKSATGTIMEPQPLTVATSGMDASCSGKNDGSATATPSGGNMNYSYQWDDNPGMQTTPTASNLVTGTYNVTVTDEKGCTATGSVFVDEPTSITLTTAFTSPLCHGDATGSATVTPAPAGTYSYQWDDAPGMQTTQTATNLPAGTYNVTVSNPSGCNATTSVTITQPDTLIATITASTDPTCNGISNGSATVGATGGDLSSSGNYSINWSTNPIQTTPTATGLAGDNRYRVTVTDDNGCSDTASIFLNNPPSIIISLVSKTDINCFGVASGALDLDTTGGIQPVTINWNDGPTTLDRTGLTAGNYTVTATDSRGCMDVQTYTITQPAQRLMATFDTTDVSCNGLMDGDAKITVTGGTSPYTFDWEGTPNGDLTDMISNLTAGIYRITVTDNLGCTLIDSTEVLEPTPIVISVTNKVGVLCGGQKTGSITVSASGGSGAPYNFQWNDPANTNNSTVNNLSGGNYQVVVTDNNLCTETLAVTLTENDTIRPTLSTYNVSCGIPNNGSAAISASGGIMPYTYTWSANITASMGAGTDSVFNLTTGNYSVTFTDANMCDSIQNFVIGTSNSAYTFRDSVVNDSCFGEMQGYIGIRNLVGGTPPYTYLWSRANETTSFISNVAAGTYTVTISDNSSCDSVATFTVLQPTAPLSATFDTTDISCNGLTDGSAKVIVQGGTPPYSYDWNGNPNGDLTDSISNLGIGSYRVTITDAFGCELIDSTTINNAPPINIAITSQTNVQCNGGSSGGATVLASGGNGGPFTYQWNDMAMTSGPTVSNLTEGGYKVYVTYAGSCIDSMTVNISEPDTLRPSLFTYDAGCRGTSNGAAAIRGNGGTTPYNYTWSPSITAAMGAGTDSVFNLPAGNYSVTVADANGCDSIQSFTINTTNSSFIFTSLVRNDSCNSSCNAYIEIQGITGGTAPYSYNWSDGSTDPFADSLCAGPYSVTISDATGCDSIISYNITAPDAITATITTLPDTCLTGTGSAAVTNITGGTPPYVFTWPNGTGNSTSGLSANNYNLTITDNNLCEAILPFTIINVAPFSINLSVTNVSCAGFRNGEILVSTTGATGMVTYDWEKPGISSANPKGLAADKYIITVTDATGCAAIDSAEVTQPLGLIINSVNVVNENCVPGNDGSAIVNASGGTTPYLYDFGNGFTSSNVATNLSAGNYTVVVQDAQFCSFVENFVVVQIPPFTIDSIVVTDASCNGGADGAISVNLSGTTPPVSYNWNPSLPNISNPTGLNKGTYTVTITDGTNCSEVATVFIDDANEITTLFDTLQDESCSPGMDGFAKIVASDGLAPYTYDWSPAIVNGAGTDSVFNLVAGVYNVTVTDANMCSVVAPFLIEAANDIQLNELTVEPTCFGDMDGSITLNPSGGVSPYTYLWFDGTTTASKNNLASGNYRVTVTDAATPPCVKETVVRLGVKSPIAVTFSNTIESCNPGNDATATLTVNGGNSPFTFNYSSGTVGANPNELINLSAGAYSVTITDANMCSKIETFNILAAQNFSLNLDAKDPTCANGMDGEFFVNVNGGIDPLIYTWNGGVLAGADPKNASAGTYTVVVTDALGCTGTETGTLVNKAEITATFIITDETCVPGNDGGAIATASNGQGNYTYTWPAGGTSNGNQVSGLNAGDYNVTITDDSMCVSIIPFKIGSSAPFTLTSIVDSVDCTDGTDGSIDLTVTNNIGTISYQWSTNVTGSINNEDQANLPAGSYSVTITDAGNNCIETETFMVGEPDSLKGNAIITPVGCVATANDGAIDLTTSGGTRPYTYMWNDGATSEDRSMLTVGNYSVTITDKNLCSAVESYQIVNQPQITIALDSTDVSCSGAMDGSVQVVSTNAINPSYSWSKGSVVISTNSIVTFLTGGMYYITVTDLTTNCIGVDSIRVNEKQPINTTIVVSNENCFPGNDGSASVSATGGTSPYTYTFSAGNVIGNGAVNGLMAGTYSVTITDQVNCMAIDTFTIVNDAPFTVTSSSTNPLCAGDSTGTATINVVGTQGMPTFLWPSGVSNPTASSQSKLAAGNYTVTITDPLNGCTETTQINITEPDSIKATAVITPENCSPGKNGTINLTVTGGDGGPYNYNWTGTSNPTAMNQNNLSAGTYFVTITDANMCIETDSFVVNAINTTIPNLVTINDGCNALGVCAGSAKSSPQGGIAPYTFEWSGPGGIISVPPTTDSIGSLCAGSYSLKITDASGCDTTIGFTINSKRIIIPNMVITDESCTIDNDGQISVSPSGGEAPYSYAWANSGVTDSLRTGLAPGSYTVTITDITGCDTVVTGTVGSEQFDYTIIGQNLSCSGTCDGKVDISIAGGNSGYTFNWSPTPPTGSGTANISDLCDGLYSVTITRTSNGCSKTDQVKIDPSTPIFPNENVKDESCNATNDGSITLSPIGGAGGYIYNWSPNVSNTATASNLVGGTYNITITDASGCDTSISVIVSSASQILATVVTQNLNCGNVSQCDGLAYVTPSNGLPPYNYNWGPGVVTGVTPDTAVGLCAGTYSVTITDATPCSIVETFTIGGPNPIAPNFNNNNSTCNISNGVVSVAPTGGSSPYTVEWFDAMGVSLGTSLSITGLNAGSYSVVITDNQGCVESFNTSINDIGAEVIMTTFTDVNCHAGNDGTATVSFSCSDPGCSVAWFSSSTMSQIGSSNTVSGLTAGDYYVEVTNNSGCVAVENVTISEPNDFQIFATVTDNVCSGGINGSINLNVSGGTGSISYTWSPAPSSGQGTNTVSGLAANNYVVTISDANGCDSIMSFTINAPSTITSTFVTTKSNCNLADGRIVATVTGGTVASSYNYQWFDGANNLLVGETSDTLDNVAAGNYALRVRDDNVCEKRFNVNLSDLNGPTVMIDSVKNAGCFGESKGGIFISVSGSNSPFTYNWTPNGETTEDITNLSAGSYSVKVTDMVGCITNQSDTVTESSEIMATIAVADATCGVCNGTAAINATGGTLPYTYLWSNGSTQNNTDSLCGGNYSVVVTDASGCTKAFDFGVNTIGGPTGETIAITAATCANSSDGAVKVTPIGGTPPYSYTWQHNGATTNTLSNLSAGTYFLTYADVRGCSRTVQVDITSPTAIQIDASIVGVTCGGAIPNGSIDLTVSGGNSPYSYFWGLTSIPDTNYRNGLSAGIYNVTVTDASGCTKSKVITVSNTGAPANIVPTVGHVSCYGSCDGTLSSNVSPSMQVDFQWLNTNGIAIAALNTDITGVCFGDYILELTTIPLNCKSYIPVSVTEPDSITLTSSIVKNISCNGECDGEVFINTRGGNILYTYSWSDPNSQQQIPAFGLCAGTYTVTATDANGCTETTSVTLTDPPLLTANITSNTNLICSSDCDATATTSATGGAAPYTYSWNGGQTTANPNNLCFGINIFTVTDARNCMASDTVYVSAIDTVVAEAVGPSIICDGEMIVLDGNLTGSSISSSGWYQSDGITLFTSTLDTSFSRVPGNYTFLLIASSGSCSDTAVYNVTVNPKPIIGIIDQIRIFGEDVAVLSITGKDPSYMYQWSPGSFLSDSTIAEPITSTREDILYTLTVMDSIGCIYKDSIDVIYSPDVDIPSGFSPNGDGNNDVWNIKYLEEFPDASVQVFNRWGMLLYEQTNGYNTPWDGTYNGKALPIGTYYYVIDLKDKRFGELTGPITIVK